MDGCTCAIKKHPHRKLHINICQATKKKGLHSYAVSEVQFLAIIDVPLQLNFVLGMYKALSIIA